jgi:hypothetical protein
MSTADTAGLTHRTAAVDRAEARVDVLGALRAVVVPWLVSRVVSLVVLFVTVDPANGESRFRAVVRLYDAGFYFTIASSGYGRLDVFQPRWAFFPGLPILIKALDAVADPEIGIFVVNQVVLLIALAGVYVLARRHASIRGATLAVWALALFPATFVFSLTYPSSLFLAATVWAFVLVEDHHDVWAALLGVVATLLRPNGIVVVLSLAVAAWSLRRIAVICTPAVVALGVWCIVCLDRTGDALAFLTAKSQWREITLVGLFHASGKFSALPHAVLGLAAIAIVLLRRRFLPRSWIVFTLLYLVPSFALGIVGLARYANECFPAFVAAGQVLAEWRPRVAVAALALSAVGVVVMAVAVVDHGLVP